MNNGLVQVLGTVRKRGLSRFSLRRLGTTFVQLLNRAVPKRDRIAVQCFPDFDDTARAIVEHCIATNRKVVILVAEIEPVPEWAKHPSITVLKRASFAGFVSYLSSRY